MHSHISTFLLHWAITALSLWASAKVFRGIKFEDGQSLLIAALVLGFANAVVKPLLILLTFPLTLITFGLFLLVINALMLRLVSSLVRGFSVDSFWTAFFASIFITLLSAFIGGFLLASDAPTEIIRMPHSGGWI